MRAFLRFRQVARSPDVQRPLRLQGQVTVEYFILFAVVALVTVIGLTTFDDDIRTSLEGFVNAAANKIAN